jgi:hypothetical protein
VVRGVIRIVHSLPGRVRLRVDALRRNPVLAQAVEQRAAAIRGVLGARANPLTGSLLIYYDCRLIPSLGALEQRLEALDAVLPSPTFPAPLEAGDNDSPGAKESVGRESMFALG